MSEIAALEGRITAALGRIAVGLDQAVGTAPSGETEALAAERQVNAQLTERVRAIKEKQETTVASLEKRLARLTETLDVQGLELQRMKKTNIALRENNRVLREAVEAGVGDGQMINKSMATELEALRASRLADMAEMDEILAELRPLVEEGADA